MGGEAQIVRRGHHHVGHHAAFEAPHAVGQDDVRHVAGLFEALGQRRIVVDAFWVGSQADEPPPALRQRGAEELPVAIGRSVEDEVLVGGLPGPIGAPAASPRLLGFVHCPSELRAEPV